ncbi:hypothetical protein [Rhizobium sp. FY34]|uniref:hypothetical protein n=1 Tax=Rhizobium sp. FY34 TaxID=2562309 RepID=UPI0010C040E0|nr:hypothetical protein [Rhizobium sp. FY34]
MNEQFNRRKFLKTVGFGAVVTSAGSAIVTSAAHAQTKMNLADAKLLKIDPKMLELKLSDPRAVKVIKLDARLPTTTPITQMGLDRSGMAALTPAAKELTKADLQAMAEGKIPARAQNLTVADISSIKVAFGSGYKVPGNLAADISCCCCTPCCCAAAVESIAA